MDESWKSDLDRWLSPFLSAFRHKARARMCPVYVAGLIGAGDRKSVQPMAARDGEVGYDQLHPFITSSPAACGMPRHLRRPCSLKPTGWLAAPTLG
jgi:SRSO17 transposase